MYEWKLLNFAEGERTSYMDVPGGCIFRTMVWDHVGIAVSTVFVPKPVANRRAVAPRK